MFRNRDQLLAETLPGQLRQRRSLALQLLEAGVAAVDPARCVRNGLHQLAGHGLDPARPVALLAMGKAALPMAEQALDLCNVQRGIVHCFEQGRLGPLVLEACGHPLPVPEAAEQGRRMLDFAQSLGSEDVVLCLVSGGASAMLECPAPGLSLDQLRETASLLMGCGASIGEINAVRSVLSRTKAGGVLSALYPAAVFNVILSDVPGEPPEVVSSGPTLPPRVDQGATEVVNRYQLWGRLPAAVAQHLRSRRGDAWQAPDDLRLSTCVAGDNGLAVDAVVDEAKRCGVELMRAPGVLTGEAAAGGAQFARLARSQRGGGFVAGGECTVVLRGAGRGGRAQEFVLGALPELHGGLIAALGTDGVDGSSDAAGALADEAVLSQCSGDFTPLSHLEHNDSHGFFARTGTQLQTGRTGTNVSDLYLYLR